MFEHVKQPEFLTEDVELRKDRWYCSHCVDTSPWDSSHGGWTGENGIRTHVEASHGVPKDECEYGRDFFQGADFKRLLDEWRASHERMIDSFMRGLKSLGGADDLIFEMGDDPPFGLLELS